MKRKRRVVPSLVRLGRRVVGQIFKMPVPREVDEEFAFHVEMRVRELLREGRSLEEARAEAIRRFGEMERVKAVCRRMAEEREARMGRTMWWEDLRQDVGFALRQLRKQPTFAGLAIVTLALGIGANTAVFSVVNGVVLRPLPYEDPDELVQIWTRYLPESGFEIPRFPISGPEILDYREQNEAMEAVGYYTTGSRTLTGPEGDPARLSVVFVDDGVFPVLGVEPALGRWFRPEDDLPGSRVVILSHDLWRSRFGADSSLVGGSVTLNGNRYEVAGVMPEGFVFPSESVDLWENFGLDEQDPPGRASHYIVGVGRIADGRTLEQARAEVEGIHAGWAEEFEHNVAHFPILNRLKDDVVQEGVRQALFLLLAAVVVVLLVACVNVANLFLARAESRQPEVAVRRAIGAGRGRLVRQFLTESLVVAVAGGILGVVSAGWLVRTILAVNPDALPRTAGVEVSGPVLAFTALATLGTVALFGVLPALHGASQAGGPGSMEGGRGATGGRVRRRFRRILVGAEVALSVVVLVVAGLVLRSFEELTSVDPGARTEGLLTFQLSVPAADYPDPESVTAFYAALTGRLEALPGVSAVSATTRLPLTGVNNRNDFVIEGRPPPAPGELARNAFTMDVRPGYFEAMGIPLLAGRTFTSGDDAGSPPVAVVSRELVRLYFPGEEPLGQRVGYQVSADSAVYMTVVGVVGDIHSSLEEEPLPQLYRVQDQMPGIFGGFISRFMIVVVRATVPPGSLVPAVRRSVNELDPALALARVQTMEELFETSTAGPRLTRNLLALFGGLALILAAVGIYGVVSYSVARRTREIGIRVALGAEAGRVVRLMVGEGARPAALGLALGVAASLALGGTIRELLYGVSPTDPATFVAIPILLLGVAVAASWWPARRASRVPPTEALREE